MEENHEKLVSCWCLSQDLNQASPEYEPEALLLLHMSSLHLAKLDSVGTHIHEQIFCLTLALFELT
jgi:hypothetical protein